VLAIAAVMIAAPLGAQAEPQGWSRHQDPGVGLGFSYPSALFAPLPGDDKPFFHYFASDDGSAKFLVGAWNNRERQTPAAFKRWLVANAGGYQELTYTPRGRGWFVLSGYRGDQIYYEKVSSLAGVAGERLRDLLSYR
jgi:hypothetical protein